MFQDVIIWLEKFHSMKEQWIGHNIVFPTKAFANVHNRFHDSMWEKWLWGSSTWQIYVMFCTLKQTRSELTRILLPGARPKFWVNVTQNPCQFELKFG